MNALLLIAGQFSESVKHLTPLGNGLINDTFLAVTETSSFVLQRINRQVFPAPEQITSNLQTINQHLGNKAGTSVKLQIPKILNTTADKPCFQDEITISGGR